MTAVRGERAECQPSQIEVLARLADEFARLRDLAARWSIEPERELVQTH